MKIFHQNGLTLAETMIIGVIVIILAVIAFPSIKVLVTHSRTEAKANAIYSALMTTRSASIENGKSAVICISDNRNNCSTAGHWEAGWLVFVDNNNNRKLDSTDNLIESHGPLNNDYTLRFSIAANAIVFRANGTTDSTGVFSLCPSALHNSAGYLLKITTTGRPQLNRKDTICP